MATSASGSQPRGFALSFSSPAGTAAIVIAVMAVIALVWLLGPGSSPPPPGTEQPSPSASATESITPTATPRATWSVTPVATATPAPTPTPLAQWTGLAWSDPFTPPFTVHLFDLVPWRDGYVAVGQIEPDQAAFLTSTDGANWTVAYQANAGPGHYPRHVVAFGDELLAFSPPNTNALGLEGAARSLVWRSVDGITWTLDDSPSWRSAWVDLVIGPMPAGWDVTQHPIQTGLVDVAAGPNGIVAIGNAFAVDGMNPVILHSTDGWTWSRASLPVDSPSALLNAVVTSGDGFVLVGANGVGADPSEAEPAAWRSANGVSWMSASVQGHDATSGGELGQVVVGTDGMVACFGPRGISVGAPRFTAPWFSSDGTLWRGPSQADPPQACGLMASDGVRIVSLPYTFHEDTGAWSPIEMAWVSIDGVSWNELALSAEMRDRTEAFWVVPDGVIYAGEQSFWFGTAIER